MIRSLTCLMLACVFAMTASPGAQAQGGATSSPSGVVVDSASVFPDATVGVEQRHRPAFEAVSNTHGAINNNDNVNKSTEGLFAQENQ